MIHENRHQPAQSERYNVIQALRAAAALLVVVTHATLYVSERLDEHYRVWHNGECGVDIFFVVSGFVMMVASRDLFERYDGWWQFATRRVIRIVPMYWLATSIKLLFLLLVPAAILHAKPDLPYIALSYLFLPSRNVDGMFEPLLGVGWTLNFEMFFYALFTLGLFLRTNLFLFIGGILTACALGALFRNPHWPAISFYLDPRVLEFFLGMTIARFRLQLTQGLSRQWQIGTAALLCGFAAAVFAPQVDSPFLIFQRIACAGLIVFGALVLESVVGKRVPRALLYIGNASYSLYLFHPLVAPAAPTLLRHIGLISPLASLVLSTFLAIVTAVVTYTAFEKPITRFLTRTVFGSKKSSPVPVAVV